MDYKLEYMERLFAKISKKKTESYVISDMASVGRRPREVCRATIRENRQRQVCACGFVSAPTQYLYRDQRTFPREQYRER